jgi:hypothetical protein
VLVPLAEEVNAIAVHGLSEDDLAGTRRCLLAMIENLARETLHASVGAGAEDARAPAPARDRSAQGRRASKTG